MKKILFILKKRHLYSQEYYATVNSGLYNSATFVDKMLGEYSDLVQIDDNNEIDKYVSQYKPSIVIIEALWIVPSKFKILQELHPNVKWVIRLHSEIPFLANEGVAIEWLKEYTNYRNVTIASNSKHLIKALEPILKERIEYLPNYYPISKPHKKLKSLKGQINIGCFGAIRPMKNTLFQAICAIQFADNNNKVLNFHINSARLEQKGENAYKNVKALFEVSKHNLVEHDWLEHKKFTKLVSTMDLCMQVSLSETYNIVAADSVNQLVPTVGTIEIPFLSYFSSTRKTKDVEQVLFLMYLNVKYSIFKKINRLLLQFNSLESQQIWFKFLKKQIC